MGKKSVMCTMALRLEMNSELEWEKVQMYRL